MRVSQLIGALIGLVSLGSGCQSNPTACGLDPECSDGGAGHAGTGGTGGTGGAGGSGASGGMTMSSSQASTSASTGGTGGMGGSGGDGGKGGMAPVNGCLAADAQDYTALSGSNPLILFPGPDAASPAYLPACIKIKEGQHVYFYGDFTAYPLSGGTVTDTTITPDATSPLNVAPVGGLGDYTLDEGVFGFYSYPQWQTMRGAIFVVP